MNIPWGKVIWRLSERIRVVSSRLRATLWRVLGARLSVQVSIGRGCVIDRPWCLSAGRRVTLESNVYLKAVSDRAVIEIGESSFIGCGSELDVLERVQIGCHTLLSPRVFIVDHTHGIKAGLRIDAQPCGSAAVIIGDDVWVGAGAVILAGVRIGNGAVIGAQSVVRENVPAGAVVAGVPARLKHYRGSEFRTNEAQGVSLNGLK